MNLLDAFGVDVGLYLVNVAVAVTLACALGVAATRLLRSRPAPVRYGLLLAALLMAFGAPGVVWIGSAVGICPLRVPVAAAEEQAGPTAPAAEPEPMAPLVEGPAPAASETPVEPMPAEAAPLGLSKAPAATPIPWARFLVAVAVMVWTVGTAIGLAVMGRGLVLVWRLRGTLRPTDDRRLARAAAWAVGVLGVSRPVEVRLSPSVPVPLSIGLVRPVIVLPEALVGALEETDLQAIILHEAAHVAHRDHWVGLLQRLALALFWWDPLVRVLSGRLSEAREEVCDNYVVRAQGDGVRFARFLVAMAAKTVACRRLTAAIGLVQHPRHGLEARVRKLLRKERNTMTRMNLTAVALAGVFAAGIAGLMVGCNIGAAKAELPGEAVAETDSPGAPATAAKDPVQGTAVSVALLPKSPIRSIREYRHFLRITAPPAAPPLYKPARLPACDFEIRSERHPTRVARIPYVGYFRQNGEPGESDRRRIGHLPAGDYLVALCVGQTRLSNVARLRIDSAFEAKKGPALELVPLPRASEGDLRCVGLVATGREQVDPEFTNMAAAFPVLLVDGVERPLVKAMAWTGPVGPLQPGQRDVRFIDFSNYGLEFAPEKTHRVRARVATYESAEVTVPASGALGKAWDEKTARLPFLRQPRIVLRGKVIGPAGQPAAGYEVGLSAPGGGRFRERCDAKGQYQFVNVPAGEYQLNANPPGKGQPIVVIDKVQIRPDRTLVQDLSLQRKFRFSGKVANADGTPAAGKEVMATWKSPDGTAEFNDFAVADAQGRYTLGAPYAEASYVGISATGPHPKPHRAVKAGRTDVDFVLPKKPKQESAWGPAVEGVQCRLRANKRAWRVGETPALRADVRNQGKLNLYLPKVFHSFTIDVDGQCYVCTTRTTTLAAPFGPGDEQRGIEISLEEGFWTAAEEGTKVSDPPRAGATRRSEARRLRLTPGRHVVRVAVHTARAGSASGWVNCPTVHAISNPVAIEVVAPQAEPNRESERLVIDLIRTAPKLRQAPSTWIAYELLSEDALRERVTEIIEATPEVNVLVRARRQIEHNHVVKLLDLLKTVGAKNVSLTVFPFGPIFALTPAPDRHGVIRGKVIGPDNRGEAVKYTVTLEHEKWRNRLGRLPNLVVSAGETFEFRNVPPGNCTLRASPIVPVSVIFPDRKTRPAGAVAEVEVTLEDKQVVEIEIVAAEITDAPQPDTEAKKESAKRTAAPGKTTVRGKVVDDATGNPVADFFTEGGKFDPADPAKVIWGYSETRSSRKDGTFSATVRWSEGWTARIVAPGYLPQPVLTQPPSPGQDAIDVVVRLKRGDTIRGRVLDHTGQGVAKAGVYLAGRGVIGLAEGPWDELQGPSVRTDAEGRFEIGGRGTDSKAIFVSAPSLYVWRADLPEPGREAVIRLPEPANLHIRYDIEGGPPAAQVRIELRTWDMPKWKALVDVVRWVEVKAGKDGLVVHNLPPGVYDISRIKRTRAGNSGKEMMLDRQLKLTLASGKTTAYNFVRETGTPISGEVVGLPKEGVDGVFVSVCDQRASGDPRQLDEWKLRTFDGLALEGNGPFQTERIPPGKYKVVVEAYRQETKGEMSSTGWRLPKWFATAAVNVLESGKPPKVRVMMRPYDAQAGQVNTPTPSARTSGKGAQVETVPAKPAAEAKKTDWGPAVEGVQIRLWTEKKTWRVGEKVVLQYEARNQGKRDLMIDHGGYGCVDILVDYIQYSPDQHTCYCIWPAPFGPGRHHKGIVRGTDRRYPGLNLARAPGKYTIRIVLKAVQNTVQGSYFQPDRLRYDNTERRWVLKENYQPPVVVSSNPIEIEIVAAEITDAPQPETDSMTDILNYLGAKRTAAPGKTTVRGKVVDDATGKPVAGFVTQAGKFDPADPAKVVWGYSETRSGRKDGTFSATVRWSEGWTARIVAPGYLPQPVLTQPPSPGQDAIDVVIRLKRGDTIRGRGRLPAGTLSPGA